MNTKNGTLLKEFAIKTGHFGKMGMAIQFFGKNELKWLFEENSGEILEKLAYIIVSKEFKNKVYGTLQKACSIETVEEKAHEFICNRIYREKRIIEHLRYECEKKSSLKVLEKILRNKVLDYIRTKLREESCPNWKRVSDDVRGALEKLSSGKEALLKKLERNEIEYQKKFVHGEKVFVIKGRSYCEVFPVEFADIAGETRGKYEEIYNYLKFKKRDRIEFLCSGVVLDMAYSLGRPFTVTDITSILIKAVPDGFSGSYVSVSENDRDFIEERVTDTLCDFDPSESIAAKISDFMGLTTITELDVIRMCLTEEDFRECEKKRKLLAQKYGITTRTVRNYEERLKDRLLKYLKDVSYEERLFFIKALFAKIEGGENE